MEYRIEITDRNNQSSGIIALEFHNDEVAVRFAGTVAKTVKDRRIELWNGDRLVKVYPILHLAKGYKATN